MSAGRARGIAATPGRPRGCSTPPHRSPSRLTDLFRLVAADTRAAETRRKDCFRSDARLSTETPDVFTEGMYTARSSGCRPGGLETSLAAAGPRATIRALHRRDAAGAAGLETGLGIHVRGRDVAGCSVIRPCALALAAGVINRTKAFFGGRRGQPLLQLYFDLHKLLHKGAVYSQRPRGSSRRGRSSGWRRHAGPCCWCR